MMPDSPAGIFSHGWVWLLVVLGPLLFFNRRLHLELQAVLYAITRKQEVALAIFSILLFPGVFLHELSHWATARLLGIRTGRFSLVPQLMPGKKLRLGFVEMASTDALREAIVGAAPLFCGSALVAYISIRHLQVEILAAALAAGHPDQFFSQLGSLPSQPDFWVWFYLVFAISSTMFPSPSDRRAWLPVGLAVLALVGAVAISGAGPWAVEHVGPLLESTSAAVATIFGVCLVVQATLLFPLWIFRVVLFRRQAIRIA